MPRESVESLQKTFLCFLGRREKLKYFEAGWCPAAQSPSFSGFVEGAEGWPMITVTNKNPRFCGVAVMSI